VSDWRIAGSYFESCNCEAICPCRMIGGVRGGRSTYGICYGVLSWLVEEGHAGDVDLGGLHVALVTQYDDDEAGSPWRFVLHVDERGDKRQRDALRAILLGELGGDDVLRLPWVRKPSELIDVRVSPITLARVNGGHELRIGGAVELRATREVEGQDEVRCLIPGYHEPGVELYADVLAVADDPFTYELRGNCAYASRFDYSSNV
jgi:hypothetical protein